MLYRCLRRLATAFVFTVLLCAVPVSAHEYWIEPLDFFPRADDGVSAHLKVGSDMKGDLLPFIPAFAVLYRVFDSEGDWRPDGRAGDRPALNFTPRTGGLNVVAYQSNPNQLEFTDPEIFPKYLDYEGLDWVMARHTERGFGLTGFSERYTRFAKALVDVGATASGEDLEVGLITELVALDNPYARLPGDRVRVQVLWQGAPEAGRQVKVFAQSGEDLVVTDLRANQDGIVSFTLSEDTTYLLNSVHMEEAEPGDRVIWESYWASLTFATR